MNHFLKSNEATTLDPTTESTPRSSDQRHAEQETLSKLQTSGGLAYRLTKRLLANCGNPPIRMVLPDGQQLIPEAGHCIGTIEVSDMRTALAIALDPLFQFGEAYADGRIEIHGDLAKCLTVVFGLMIQTGPTPLSHRVLTRLRRPYANTLTRSRYNIQHHYDLGNDFYRMWLDENMVYTCAYFAKSNFTLEQAQTAKLDHVCRKLCLRPGMHVLETGCGWGSLALHMARNYGVQVTAYNISRQQIEWARDRARQDGLQGSVRFVQDDWRNATGKFDAFASVGMMEHVGAKNYVHFGQVIGNSLVPGGTGLIHTIGQNQPNPFNPWIERRIFPGAYVPTIRQMMDVFEASNMSVLDLENLRLHYAETLRHWLDRFESAADQIREQFDEPFIRMWRLYLAGSVAAFASGCLQLYQVVFTNGPTNDIPRTREHLYESTNSRIARVIKRFEPTDWQSEPMVWKKP